jgi:hypothetical protein
MKQPTLFACLFGVVCQVSSVTITTTSGLLQGVKEDGGKSVRKLWSHRISNSRAEVMWFKGIVCYLPYTLLQMLMNPNGFSGTLIPQKTIAGSHLFLLSRHKLRIPLRLVLLVSNHSHLMLRL